MIIGQLCFLRYNTPIFPFGCLSFAGSILEVVIFMCINIFSVVLDLGRKYPCLGICALWGLTHSGSIPVFPLPIVWGVLEAKWIYQEFQELGVFWFSSPNPASSVHTGLFPFLKSISWRSYHTAIVHTLRPQGWPVDNYLQGHGVLCTALGISTSESIHYTQCWWNRS